ncbi:MAG: putative DNA binding domain-containing protein [Raoultibacter sp.]
MKESHTLEFKREVTKDFCKEIVAFANTSGGRILVGVADDGQVVGIDDTDAAMLQISNMIVSNICPEIRPFVTVEATQIDGLPVVSVSVEEGDRKPYCIAQKGFVPAGVYLRTGPGNSHATQEIIKEMIRLSDGDSFELCRCTNQDLTFTTAQRIFLANDFALEREHMQTLGMINLEGYFTNLGLLLSDQCEHTIKCAVFEDASGIAFQSRKEFTGSVLGQLEEALEFLGLNNRLRSHFKGVIRQDTYDYPLKAVREALLNAIVHRDYNFPDSTIINVFSNRIEFVSLGGLAKGVTREDIMNGVSVSRNPKLALIFYRLKLMESYGIGIRSIKSLYATSASKPEFKTSPASFVSVLPNMSSADAPQGEGEPVALVAEKVEPISGDSCNALELIMAFVAQHAELSRLETDELLGVSKDRSLQYLEQLVEAGRLERVGIGRGTKYRKTRASE